MKKWKIYLVPHTHWDKEWYFTKEVSDAYLVDNMKQIIEANERNENEAPFVFDAQYSVVDDFLNLFPQKLGKVKKIIKENKLVVGPWYTQTDMFNATGESIVRNLLIGTKLSEKLGRSMRVGYLPDTFGFNSNLPQIISKTQNKGIINWRGGDDELLNNNLFNIWEADDGTKCPTYSFYKHGYFTGVGGLLQQYNKKWSKSDNWQEWDSKTRAKEHAQYYINFADSELDFLKTKAASSNNRILMPVGSDQMPMVSGWTEIVEKMNELDSVHEWILADFEKFMDDLISDPAVMENANIIKGEFRNGRYARAHKTITSSRYDIKKLSKKVEYQIYNELEPLSVIFSRLGGEYPFEILLDATKKLVASHAHDSLGGCNTDETNRSILNRLEASSAIVESQTTLIKKRICDALSLGNENLIIFNTAPYTRTIQNTLEIHTKNPFFEIFNEENQQVSFSVVSQKFFNNDEFSIKENSHIFGSDYKETDKIVDEGPINATNILLEENAKGKYTTIIKFNEIVKGLGYKILKVKESKNNTFALKYNKNFNEIENDLFKISVDEKMNFTLLNKKNNVAIQKAFQLEATFDAGDTYDYSPSHHNPSDIKELLDFEVSTENNNHIQIMTINSTFLVPEQLDSEDKVKQNIELQIILENDLINFKLAMTNQAADIRWRFLSATQVKNNQYSYADQSFALVKRLIDNPSHKKSIAEKWVDVAIEIEAMESMVALKNQEISHAIFTKGTNEYQIIGHEKETIALTLFRAVSYIGRRHLIYRKGRASGVDDYPHATPESNLKVDLIFEFAISIEDNIAAQNKKSKEWCWPNTYYQTQSINVFHWKGDTFVMTQRKIPSINQRELSLVDIKDINNLVVTTVKKSWNQKFDIVRLYNPTEQEITINTEIFKGEVDLLDNKIKTFNNIIKPNEIKSYILK
ncbi:alpha-mannosidase [Spiroplasma sabaudiense Ar-1343]|uniref:Alpha-mannosidase n=1 Tax=Spiroplasma sabaudiense Ar-1343 TaxID=1276257 RepID=W6ABP9_9MOLU|nr:glycosyl hydrolase-related protein [Spiroplasma sabaudiense]AHI54255.1 alpha-mannosidase [Spiroplasma sabaudiense Ar-1343]